MVHLSHPTESLDTKLDFSLKYNWWTPEEKKESISESARFEYIMKYGSFDELLFLFKNRQVDKIKKVFENIKKDEHGWNKKRRFMIEYLIGLQHHTEKNDRKE